MHTAVCWLSRDFNPPTPWGVGPTVRNTLTTEAVFQSTHSVGSGTVCRDILTLRHNHFNPPTPWGVGLTSAVNTSAPVDFNPPTPWGVGQLAGAFGCALRFISIHPLRGEWDASALVLRRRGLRISIHPLRGEWDFSVPPVRRL